MDSFTLNKIAGAVLGTCLVGMGIGIIADEIYYPKPPKKPGFELPKATEEGGEKKPTEVPLSVLLSKADAKRGEADAKVCGACHNFEEGAGAKVGPDLYGVVDREKGSAQGFDYSAGMKKKGGKWTYADLFEFLKKPSAYVQGTKMGYPGEENPEKRADIIVYLHTLSKNPAPLPKVSEADKKAAEGGGGAEAKKEGGGGDDLVSMIAASDPKKGESDAQICGACHNFKEGAGAKVGPDLYGVVDREKGSVKDFDYSAGMKKKGGKWTYADLNQFITKPQSYVQGTKMGYPGEANPKKRAEIIAYLRTLAKDPAPLPKAGGGEKKAEGGAANAGGQPAGGGGDLMKEVAATDPKKGEADTQVCRACHVFKEGGGNMVGPNLYGVVGRDKGSVQGFDYSAGMKKKGGKWTLADLDQFITKPSAYVQGTKMGYPGESNAKKRIEILAYLHSLSKTPISLDAGGDAKKSEAAPSAAKPEEKKPEEKKTEAAPPPPPKPEAKKTEAAPPPPPKPEEKKTEAAPPPPPKPEEKKTEAAPPPPPKPEEKKTEAAPPPAAKSEEKAEATPPAKEPSSAASAGAGPEPYVAVDPMYPSEKAEAAALPKEEKQAPRLEGDAAKNASTEAGGGPEPYSAPSPDEASQGQGTK